MNKNLERIYNGIIKENPVFIMMLGMCPALAVSTSVTNALGMGACTIAVLVISNIVISLVRKIIPDEVRLPAFIVIVASFVTVVELIMKAYFVELNASLGVYIPLIVVNCIILGRAEMFASKNPVGKSALDGLGMGIGFTFALCVIATIREVLGAASFAGIAIPFLENFKIEFFVKAPGGMVVYGLLIALIGALTNGKAPKKKEFSCAGCPSAGHCGNACTANGKENA